MPRVCNRFTILLLSRSLAAMGVALLLTASSAAQEPAAVLELQETIAGTIARCEGAVVAIAPAPAPPTADNPNVNPFGFAGGILVPAEPIGCGVVIDSAGLVLTQSVNVRSGQQYLVRASDGATHTATIRAADPRSGLAVLAIGGEVKLPALPLAEAEVQKGQFVVAIGNAPAIWHERSATASWGSVANVAQRAQPDMNLNNTTDATQSSYSTTLHHLGTLIQTDAKLGWSSGGGALVNLRGELVGITTSTASIAGHEAAAGYAIPLGGPFRRIVDELRAGREVEYGLLGVSLADPRMPDIRRLEKPTGGLVQATFPGTPAASAGLVPGDVIVAIGSEPVTRAERVQLLLGVQPPGSDVELTVVGAAGNKRQVVTRLAKLWVAGDRVATVPPPSWRGLVVDFPTAMPYESLAQATATGLLRDDRCVLVRSVEPGSPAAEAGLAPGMFLSQVDGQPAGTPAKFHRQVSTKTGPVTVQVLSVEGEDAREFTIAGP